MHNVVTKLYAYTFLENIWAKITLLAIVLLAAYYNAISLMVKTWLNRDDYSHGFLVPLISLYFVWAEREKLKQIPVQPNIVGGIFLFLLSAAMISLGTIASVGIVQQMAIIVVMPAIVLLLMGTGYLKALVLPLTYLIFMVPVLDVIVERIRLPFQLITAKSSGIILKFLGIPIFQNMEYIELPDITLQIADVCSGVNYFVSIMSIAIPLAYFALQGWKFRSVMLLFAIFIGVMANIIRVALIGIWAYNGGEIVHGPFHIFQGLFVSVFGFISLFTATWLLVKIRPSNIKTAEGAANQEANLFTRLEKDSGSCLPYWQTRENSGSMPPSLVVTEHSALTRFTDVRKFNKAWVIAIACMLLLSGSIYLYQPKPIPLKTKLDLLPLNIGKWKGTEFAIDKTIIRAYGADSEVARIYRNDTGREVVLYIGYYELQRQDKELITYRLTKFYKNAEEIEIPTIKSPLKVNKTILKEKSNSSLVVYWYDLNGWIVANAYKAKLITALDGAIHRRTNGAIIMIYSALKHSEDLQNALNNEMEFAKEIIPTLHDYLP
ncbi:MAG: exosortase W [Nitrospirae bacterium]|nr:exosortase W [Nitrospirota bacterium]